MVPNASGTPIGIFKYKVDHILILKGSFLLWLNTALTIKK